MRIALLALHFAEYASRLALALSARHDVLLVLHSRNAREELSEDLRTALERALDVRYLDLPRLRHPRLLPTMFSIERVLRDWLPEILHVQEFHPAYTGWAMLSLRRDIPVVLTVHDPVPHTGVFSTDNWRWRVVQWFRWKASRVIVHGPRMRAQLEALTGGVASRIDVVPHGTLGWTAPDSDIAGYEPGTFLFFGRINVYKGLGYLLDAGEILLRRGHAFRVVVAGTGADLDRHRKRIAGAAWVELIDRYIPVPEVAALFRRAMALVLPYTDATQSGVGAMALAFARPVVASSVGDVPEIVIEGRTGLLVAPRDAIALADAMEKLLVDRPMRDALADGAAQLAKEELSWPRIAKATDLVYHRAVASWPAQGSSRKRLSRQAERRRRSYRT